MRSAVKGTSDFSFPLYTAAEALADRALHVFAVPAAIIAIVWLLRETVSTGSAKQVAAVAIYGGGLIGMLTVSAAYNLTLPSRRKELLRRVDHAMIFVMLPGTFTPFALSAVTAKDGLLLCAPFWAMAAIGATVKLAFPRRSERLLLALYLVMGWMMLGIGWAVDLHLPGRVLSLLIAGGAAYSFGAFIHARAGVPFHNAAWHALVLLGAGLHWTAVAWQSWGLPNL